MEQSIANNRERDRWIELNAINSISLDLCYYSWLLLFSFSLCFLYFLHLMCTYQKGKWKHQRETDSNNNIMITEIWWNARKDTLLNWVLDTKQNIKWFCQLLTQNSQSYCHLFSVFVMMLDRVYRHNKNQEFTYGARSEKQQYLIYVGNVLADWNTIKSTESRIWCCVRYALRKKMCFKKKKMALSLCISFLPLFRFLPRLQRVCTRKKKCKRALEASSPCGCYA